MKIKHVLVVLSAIFSTPALSQQSQIKYEVEAQAIGTTNDAVPFWMRSNQFGSIPLNGVSGSFIGRAYKDYESTKTTAFDWGAGFEGRANAGEKSKLLLIEAYGKVKASIFQLKIGRTKDVMGLNGDTSLTSGNFSVSGNALGVPKIELSIPNYYRIPLLDGLFSIKGTFSHGWLGNVPISKVIGIRKSDRTPIYSNTDKAVSYFHQKSLYARLGKEDWKLNLYGGLNHQVYWGNEKKIYGNNFDISSVETFLYVAIGKTYGAHDIANSKIGNQLGSIDVGFDYQFSGTKLTVYRQNFYDVGALSKLANIRDGLNGISLENSSKYRMRKLGWKKVLLEVLYTKHQAGEFGSILTKSGDEDYYNNYFYKNGWSYQNSGLGTPFISTKHSTVKGLPSHPDDFFINNRVIAIHSGIEGYVGKWMITTKLSYSANYGTFGTSEEGHSTGPILGKEPIYGLFGRKDQFSIFIESNRTLKNNLEFGFALAVDKGDLLYNSSGLIVKINKSF